MHTLRPLSRTRLSLSAPLRQALRSPVGAAYTLRARLDPRATAELLARRSRKAGIRGVHLILSFDCDTDEDIATVTDVHRRLAQYDIRPTYAVAGELLKRGAEVYGRLAADGAEFINHGYREHTYFDAGLGRYASCYFYDELSSEQVREDVRGGHDTLRSVLGKAPCGYRTPHFGTYQSPAQLRYLHQILTELGYRFSSSSGPLYALRYGPVFSKFGLPELPCSGAYSRPLQILDSWGFFAAPDRSRTPANYLQECTDLVDALGDAGTGILNLYADPSHVADSEEFFSAMQYCAAGARPTSYGRLLEEFA